MQSTEDHQDGAALVIASLTARLAKLPPEEWRFDQEDGAVVLEALLNQLDVGAEPSHGKNPSARYASFSRKMRRMQRLNSWTAVGISALFFALFLLDHRAVDAIVSGVWAIVAAMWARAINSRKD